MHDLAKAEQAFKDLQEQGVFTQKQVDEELNCPGEGRGDCAEVALTLEEAAKAAKKVGSTRAKNYQKKRQLKAARKYLSETDDPPKPSSTTAA